MRKLIDALIEVESGGDNMAMGDLGKAYGILQIQQGCLTDVNKAYEMDAKLEDLLGDEGEEKSKYVFQKYMEIYATRKRLGRVVTDQDRARIWNGGPNGWQRSSTRGYWDKVSKILYAK